MSELDEEVSLIIEDEVFKVRKELLSEYSDYFRAMFSGNYVENKKPEIKIDMIDAASVKIILKYMEIGLIDLLEYPITTIGELANAANFLQITELMKQIECTLDLQIKETNWLDIMKIADDCSFTKLKLTASSFGLMSLKSMKPEHIPTIEKLYWYLSHPYLYVNGELDVFNFGLQWITIKQLDVDALLIILSCLDYQRLSKQDLKEMISLISTEYANSLGLGTIECFQGLRRQRLELSIATITKHQQYITEAYTERVYHEVYRILSGGIKRMLKLTPTVPMWIVRTNKPEVVPHYMYTYKEESGFEKWLEVADKELWGWSVAAWSPTKVVVVCGERGRGTGNFTKDVKIYDTLKKEWIHHGVELPPRRHAGLTIIGDTLYIVGGVGGFRIVLDTAISYDLKERSFRKIAKLPDTIQNPAVCCHEGKVYSAGQKHIYRYETDRWVIALPTDIRTSCMNSFKGYIYCTQNYFSHLYRFKPDVTKSLEMISYFTNPPAAICNLGNKLIVFTRTMCGQTDVLAVEEYKGESTDEQPTVLFSKTNLETKVNDVGGACTLVLDMPLVESNIPEYLKAYLNRYMES